MSKIVCVTNRKLCHGDFLVQIEKIAKCKPSMLVLREKDLSEAEYKNLARQVIKICNRYNCKCVLHKFAGVAKELQHKAIHLPLEILETLSKEERDYFDILGCSCHSLDEAKKAEELGCTYIFAGHIFETDCKKGLPGRGIGFLEEICSSVNVPVIGIGGVHKGNVTEIIEAGVRGVAVMSGFMNSDNVYATYASLLTADSKCK